MRVCLSRDEWAIHAFNEPVSLSPALTASCSSNAVQGGSRILLGQLSVAADQINQPLATWERHPDLSAIALLRLHTQPETPARSTSETLATLPQRELCHELRSPASLGFKVNAPLSHIPGSLQASPHAFPAGPHPASSLHVHPGQEHYFALNQSFHYFYLFFVSQHPLPQGPEPLCHGHII